MRISTELIKKIRANKPSDYGGDDDQWLAEKIGDIEKTRRDLSRLDADMQIEKDRHSLAMKALNDTVKIMQMCCNHLDTTYHPDASGNNDSSTVCNICGAYQ